MKLPKMYRNRMKLCKEPSSLHLPPLLVDLGTFPYGVGLMFNT